MAKLLPVLLIVTLLAVLVSATTVSAIFVNITIQLPTDGSPDTVRLVLNGTNIECYINGGTANIIPLAAVTNITVEGSDDDDTLTVDFSGGSPVPSGGLTFNGGLGSDALVMTGGSNLTVVINHTGPGSGNISVGGAIINYTGLEPISDSVSGNTTVNATSGNNTITYGPAVLTPGDGRVAVDAFETYEFKNKTSLTINALDGDDHITLNNSGLPAGLQTVTVNGGLGNDTFDLLDAGIGLTGPVTLNGGAGNDTFHVSPSTSAIVNVDGGDDIDDLVVNAEHTKALDNGTAVIFPPGSGFQNIYYTNIETVTLINGPLLKGVGGEVALVDKSGLIIPWIGLIAAFVLSGFLFIPSCPGRLRFSRPAFRRPSSLLHSGLPGHKYFHK